jgi:GT2 family glycosyltransferase
MALDLSIIIVNWNTRDLLQRCIADVYANTGSLDYEVIVVDNASQDDSVALLRREFPKVQVIENETNTGFSVANNQGIRISTGRYCLLLNTDAFVHPGALETMVKFMDENPQAGAGGCRLYNEDGSLQRSCTSFPTLATELWQALWLDRTFPRSRIFGRYWMTYWDFDEDCEVDSVIGACMILRRDALDEVGLLDEGYFMYSEEVDLCFRMKQAGWKVMFTPKATATHIWGGTSKRISNKTTFLRLFQSRIRFFRKHYGRTAVLLYKSILFGGSITRVMGGLLAFLLKRNEYKLRHAHNYWALLCTLSSI